MPRREQFASSTPCPGQGRHRIRPADDVMGAVLDRKIVRVEMTASQRHITPNTPMGATLVDGGATFRVWAPRAREVYVALGDTRAYRPLPGDRLVEGPSPGHWAGFMPGVGEGDYYRFYVVGAGEALKRDPRGRGLGAAGVTPD